MNVDKLSGGRGFTHALTVSKGGDFHSDDLFRNNLVFISLVNCEIQRFVNTFRYLQSKLFIVRI